jgi:hypothetical protein
MDDSRVKAHFQNATVEQLSIIADIVTFYTRAHQAFRLAVEGKTHPNAVAEIHHQMTEHMNASYAYIAEVDKFVALGGKINELMAYLTDIKNK